MKNLVVFTIISVVFLTGCEPMPLDATVRRFVIPQGEHYAAGRTPELLQQQELRFTAQFDSSAIYDLGDRALQTSKNKLLGFSDCNSDHHTNSARFGWQWLDGKLEIHAYCYVNGERKEAFIGTVGIDEMASYSIRLTETHYVFTLGNARPVTISRGNTCERGAYYILWPYFGGGVPAPHDVTISISITR